MPITYEPITTTTLGSAQASVTFSSIPSTYTDLRLVIVGNSSNLNSFNMRFNGDSSAVYSYCNILTDGSSLATFNNTGMTYIRIGPEYANPSTTIQNFINIDIFSYTGSRHKSCILRVANDQNGSGSVETKTGCWGNTSAISSITFYPNNSGNVAAGTRATLYGILRA